MIITHIFCQFSETQVNKAVRSLQLVRDKVLATDKCHTYQIHKTPGHNGAVFICQTWSDLAAFDAYRASDLFASMIGEVKPMMSAAPKTDVFEAKLIA
ncbi:MAG: antibiotic biosynthesis monooxygenase [Pseudomonadales bacterium]|nr:antibiotic biosynthesis monooxygenase [Pseudomonadales bacterium]